MYKLLPAIVAVVIAMPVLAEPLPPEKDLDANRPPKAGLFRVVLPPVKEPVAPAYAELPLPPPPDKIAKTLYERVLTYAGVENDDDCDGFVDGKTACEANPTGFIILNFRDRRLNIRLSVDQLLAASGGSLAVDAGAPALLDRFTATDEDDSPLPASLLKLGVEDARPKPGNRSTGESPAPVPEPLTLSLMLAGGALLAARRPR
jgi:hypothetical protein